MRSQKPFQIGDSRRFHRDDVALAASALALDRSRSVIISDLSSDGALVDGRDLPLPGEDLLMVVGSLDTFAKVVWRTGERAGIQFDEAIPQETLAQMKQEGEWMTVAGWYR